ncbi:hypothetical protein J21TS3_24840 [Paenibacillus cookii]|uniref:YqzL family protein n=1 Tax=Paenibacillus cookii TaxID=157839 RepID=A0ABQ4LWZ7_9BACL|nr:hypothetical protein J21TS3_24840 [Paenibacillus cookii]
MFNSLFNWFMFNISFNIFNEFDRMDSLQAYAQDEEQEEQDEDPQVELLPLPLDAAVEGIASA